MALASSADVNVWLDGQKVVTSGGDDTDEQRMAENLIRGYLAGRIPATTLATWTGPTQTPELIRGVAGRLVAAFRYRKLYSEDDTGVSEYATMLYNEAMSILTGIVNGTIDIPELIGVTTVTTDTSLDRLNFYPNDDTPANDPDADRHFTWSKQF